MLFFILIFIKQLLTEYPSVSYKQRWLATARDRTDKKKLTPLEERFIQITSRKVTFLTANRLCITSRNCFLYASVHRNCQEPLRCTMRMLEILTFCPFEKHFVTGTALNTNDVLQYLVLDKIVIAFTATKILLNVY